MQINYDVLLYYWELYLLVLVRITAFVYTAPFFNLGNVPRKVKLCFSIFLAYIIFSTMPEQQYAYNTIFEYGILIARETVVGLTFGFCADICMQAIGFAGYIIDINIGLSMATIYDPATKQQTNISGTFYQYILFLLMFITGLYQYLIRAIVDTFNIIPVGEGMINYNMYSTIIGFVTDYFVIGFRIALPIFICLMLLNCILGILAKIAPQMNMFAVGMQLKLLVGLFVMFISVALMPKAADVLMVAIKSVMNKVAEGLF